MSKSLIKGEKEKDFNLLNTNFWMYKPAAASERIQFIPYEILSNY